jgi:hypothetical protein
MREEMDQFLAEGIARYVEARETIAAFEQGVGSIVEQAAKTRNNWRPLRDVEIGRVIINRSNQSGYWVAIEITGTSPRSERTVVDCGLWWKCGKTEGPIVYVNYFKEPKRVTNFPWREEAGGIQSFSAWQRTFLYLPLQEPAEINTSLNRLWDALLKQLK